MPVHPQAQTILDAMSGFGLVIDESTNPVAIRQAIEEFAAAGRAAAEPVAHVENREIPGPAGNIPVRIYRPGDEDALPVLVWFHGGGWTIGSLETHDLTCRSLANAVG